MIASTSAGARPRGKWHPGRTNFDTVPSQLLPNGQRAASAAVCPLSSRRRISSFTASNADTTNRQPAACELLPHVRVFQDVLHLGRHVERQVWIPGVCMARTTRCECRTPFRKSGSAKVMWRAPAATSWSMSASTTFWLDDSNPPVIHDWDGAVPARVHAPAAGLRVSHRRLVFSSAPCARNAKFLAASVSPATRWRDVRGPPGLLDRACHAKATSGSTIRPGHVHTPRRIWASARF